MESKSGYHQKDIREFRIAEARNVRGDLDLTQAWDFGPVADERENPACYTSYAYHSPFGRHREDYHFGAT